MRGREQVLAPVADPSNRSFKHPRQRRNRDLLGIDRRLRAEAAADIARDHADEMLGQVEMERQRAAHQARTLCRRVEGQLAGAGIVLGDASARFDRDNGVAMKPKAFLDDEIGGRWRVKTAARELARNQQVGASLLVDKRRVRGERGFRVGHDFERFVFHGDPLQGIFGKVAALRDHGSNRLAHVAHDPGRECRDRRHLVTGHRRRRDHRTRERRHLGAGDDRDDARARARRRRVDREDSCVRMLRAQKRGMQRPRR
jgi:hypothetical protein